MKCIYDYTDGLGLGFSVAAPNLWNSIPDNLKSENTEMTFHRQLKSYLFKLAYPPAPAYTSSS